MYLMNAAAAAAAAGGAHHALLRHQQQQQQLRQKLDARDGEQCRHLLIEPRITSPIKGGHGVGTASL